MTAWAQVLRGMRNLVSDALQPVVERLEFLATRLAELDEHAAHRAAEVVERVGQGAMGKGGPIPISGDLIVETVLGTHVVVPGYNLDVAAGIIRNGIIEPWVTRLVRRILRPGDTFINVGANFGFFAVLGAQCVGRNGAVIAVEANPYVFPYLLRSVYFSGYPDVVRCYNFAAYMRENEELTLAFDPQFIGGGSVVGSSQRLYATPQFWSAENVADTLDDERLFVARSLNSEVTTLTRTLDGVCAETDRARLLLMDIEGAEAPALLGARRLLDGRPDVIMEWSPTYAKLPHIEPLTRQSLEMLETLGYLPYFIRTDGTAGLEDPPQLLRSDWQDVGGFPHGNIYVSSRDPAEAVGADIQAA